MRGSAIKNSIIHKNSKIESGTQAINLKMGRHSYSGYDCNFLNVEIKSFCSIASKVIIGGAHHPLEFVSTSPVFLSHKDSLKTKFAKHEYLPVLQTTIGHDVWIGEGVYIKAGITVGDGAVIGTGAVVTRNIPPYAIVAGNPAKLIRMRFDEDTVNAFIKMQWWNLSDAKLIEVAQYFHDPQYMLRKEGFL